MSQNEFLLSPGPKSIPLTAFPNSADVKPILPVSQLNILESYFFFSLHYFHEELLLTPPSKHIQNLTTSHHINYYHMAKTPPSLIGL